MNKPVLVTGAAGFIGSHLVDELTQLGQPVVMIDNLNDFYSPDLKAANVTRSLRSPLATFYKIDVADEQAMHAVCDKEQPVSVAPSRQCWRSQVTSLSAGVRSK